MGEAARIAAAEGGELGVYPSVVLCAVSSVASWLYAGPRAPRCTLGLAQKNKNKNC